MALITRISSPSLVEAAGAFPQPHLAAADPKLLLFETSGVGKTHLAIAITMATIE